MTKYWVSLALIPHATHPLSIAERPRLMASVDERPSPGAGDRRMRPEHSVGPLNGRAQAMRFEISEQEYNAERTFEVHLWAEPIASAALMEPRSHDGICVGRLTLTRRNMKRRGAVGSRLPGVDGTDMHMHFEVTVVNSVSQYIADEMNTNVADTRVTSLALKMAELNASRNSTDNIPGSLTVPSNNWLGWSPNTALPGKKWSQLGEWWSDNWNQYNWGHLVHKDEGWAGFGQDLFFFGGGEWDHKPRIRPVWGAFNRLGNSGDIWFYDIWSNIHYGYVGRAAGLPLEVLTSGAGRAQAVDSGSSETETGDDLVDTEGVVAGYDLHAPGKTVTIDDLNRILKKHPHWEKKKRFDE